MIVSENIRVFLFGATGTVGAYASLYLKERGCNVIAVGRRDSDGGFFAENGMRYVSADISEKGDFRKLEPFVEEARERKMCIAVVHLAGAIPARMRNYNPREYIDTVLTGTLNVLDFCVGAAAVSITFAQSVADASHLYGSRIPIPADIEQKFPIDNDHSVYAICKNAATSLIEHYHARYALRRFILRFPNIYLYHPNPYYFLDGEKRWQSYRYLIDRASRGLPVELWGDPEKVRDMVYVKDCCQIIWRSVISECQGGFYNVGTGVGTSFREQVEGIVEVFAPSGGRSEIVLRPDKPSSVEYIMDICKTRRELGYTPEYDYIAYLKDFKAEREAQRFEKLWGKESDFQ